MAMIFLQPSLTVRKSFVLRGFTLIELLIAIAILGVLSTVGFANFTSARIKAADIKKKSDLATIAKSLEAYVNDHRAYPDSLSGKILCQPPADICDWGDPFTDSNGTIYAATLPEPSGTEYIYTKSGSSYTLYTYLANENDPALDTTITQACGSNNCNYKITSSNTR